MALSQDDTVCFCFHVTLRKVETFCRREKPRAVSQISDCLSAGTGCGWCVPMLRKVHRRLCGEYRPWWHDEPDDGYHSAERDSESGEIDLVAYARGREEYLKHSRQRVPEGQEPADGEEHG